MVQPSPQLNCVCGSITLPNFHSWQSNPAPLNRCMFTQCFNTIAISALPEELFCHLTTWSSHVAGRELHVPGCGTPVAATSKYAIISCALSSRIVVFVYVIVLWILLLWDSCTLSGRNRDCQNDPTVRQWEKHLLHQCCLFLSGVSVSARVWDCVCLFWMIIQQALFLGRGS